MGLSLRDGYVGSTPYTIVKSVKENSFAYSEGCQAGDLILSVSTKEKGTQNLSGIHLVRSYAYEHMLRKERPLTVILRRGEDVVTIDDNE